MNLRDQLVKAGLSSKKDAKKAANKLRAEKKKAKKSQPNKPSRKTIQAYKFSTEEAKKKKKKGGKNTKRKR